jgi:alkanesulfonate monooxygenase SsuD/methylene tetrahydromethanopterin reductase-like flavin-dependent oxidoreductase (luciferase family)
MFPIQFGFCLPIFAFPGARLFRTPNYAALDVATTLRLAHLAESLGYDSLWVADHLMLGRDQAIMEGWTTLAALAGSTTRAKLGMIHQGHFFRNPAHAAKMTATLDQISGGRFIYFVDGGYGRQEHYAYGLPYAEDVATRTAHVVDGLKITLALWTSEQPLTHQGSYYHVVDALCNPKPVQQPHPPVWFGEAHPSLLAATAQYGQGWNTVPVSLEELDRRLDALEAACQAVGRSSADLEKSLEIQILVAPDRPTLRARLQEMINLDPGAAPLDPGVTAFLQGDAEHLPPSVAASWLVGTPDEVAAQVYAYIDRGITHFMLWFMDAPQEDGLRLFAQEVAPRFRQVVTG